MKITCGTFSLCQGEQNGEGVEDFRINGRRVVQVAEYLRGAGGVPLTRGNKVNTVTFGVTREWATIGAAEQFLFNHAATVPASGNITFLTGQLDGVAQQFVATAAAIESDEGIMRGITTTHRYTLICGPVTASSALSIY